MALIERYSTTKNGSMVFTGNTLGLSKSNGQEIGAFISLDTSLQEPLYPAGSTLLWQENGSAAILDILAGSTVLYAELQWGGTAVAVGGNDVSASIDVPITFNTPMASYTISPDLTTSQTFSFIGNTFYSRSADVTSIIQLSGAGTYSVEGVPGCIAPSATNTNTVGWTLGVIYENSTLPVRNMTIYSGLQGVYLTTNDFNISGFLAPPVGTVNARILVSAMEGDPGVIGDQFKFGPTAGTLVPLSGPNNLVGNFFASQINYAGSENPLVGQLDPRGTDGTLNATPGVAPGIGVRYGYDITNVLATNFTNNQTNAVVQLTSTGDAYAVPLLGLQLDAVGFDFGDAPDTSSGNGQGNYSTLLANNGPRHGLINNLKLGTKVTFEDDAYQNTAANGDDIPKGIQDDGLISSRVFPLKTTVYKMKVQYTNSTGANANIYAWVDFNQDGIFQLNEASAVTVVPSSGTNPRTVILSFNVTANNTLTDGSVTYTRIRITTNNLVNTNGLPTQEDTRSLGVASDGEVEDYLISVNSVDFGDAPDTTSGNGPNDYSTLYINNGPMHNIVNELTLGTGITSEADAYQSPNALGDDTVMGIQDDGIKYPVTPIVYGSSTYSVDVTYVNNTGKTAYLYGWVDFNKDGIFELNESTALTLLPPISNAEQQTTVVFNVPSTSTLQPNDTTFMRFRITTDPLNNTNVALNAEDTRSLGLALDGEVEDYQVGVIPLEVKGVVWYDLNCNGLIDPLEPLAQGVTVKLFNVNNTSTPVAITSTDVNGSYDFTNLPAGEYYVVVEPLSGYGLTLPYVGTNNLINSNVDNLTGASQHFILSSDNKIQIIDAGLCKCYKIAGQTFFDCKSNGLIAYNTPYLYGVTVILEDSLGNEITSTITDCDGYYEFDCVKPGNYIVKFIPPPSMGYSVQNLSYYGSKPSNGIANVTVQNQDILNIFAGFTGGFTLKQQYCTTCTSSNGFCGSCAGCK